MRKPRLNYNFSEDPKAPAWIYAIQSFDLVKIGMTRSPIKRAKALRLHNPHPMKLLMYRTVPRNVVRSVEKRMHELLASWHHSGEWFSAPLHEIRTAARIAIFEAMKVHKMDLALLRVQRRAMGEALEQGHDMERHVRKALTEARASFSA